MTQSNTEVDLSLNGGQVVAALERAAKRFGYPQVIQVDNGSEFQSKVLDAWAFEHEVKLDFIRPGKPVDNCFIESFNARLSVGRSKRGGSTTTTIAHTVPSAIDVQRRCWEPRSSQTDRQPLSY